MEVVLALLLVVLIFLVWAGIKAYVEIERQKLMLQRDKAERESIIEDEEDED